MGTKSKIAVITGGSRGLGRSMALKTAATGVDIVITYNTNKSAADEVVQEIRGMGRKAVALQLDTSKVSSFRSFVETFRSEMKREWGTEKFDFLVNNAGTALYKPLMETTEEEFDYLVDIHFKGVFFLSQTMLPLINDGGRVLNISSGLARFAFPGSSAYGSLKAAVESLSRYMAKELAPRKITVNTLAPGPIATDFGGGRTRDNKEMNAMLSGMTALGRVGEADDIGGLVALLLQDGAGWINGQRIEASGGILL